MNLVERGLLSASSWLAGVSDQARVTSLVASKASKASKAKAAPRQPGPYDSRGVMGRWMPGLPAWWGQPNVTELASGISALRMRDVALKSPTTAAALNAILDYSSNVPVRPRMVDAAQKVPPRAQKLITDLLTKPNDQDTERRFRRKLLRDLATLGYAAVEIERDLDGNVANLYVLDAARMRVDFDKHGKVLGYDMLDIYGQPIPGPAGQDHTWLPDSILWYTLDAISESQSPHARVEQLFALAVIERLMLSFIGGRFTDSNIPFGLMDLGDVSESELDDAIALWNQQVTTEDHAEHRIIFTGSKGGAKWLPFGYALKDLEAPELLSRIRLQILGILGVTVNELGEADNVNKSNGYNLSYAFKKRAIEPLLDEYTQTTTRHLVWEQLNFPDIELGYDEIDSRDELLQAQIDDAHLKSGLVSINQVRNRRGDPSIPGGEEPSVMLGASVIPISMVMRFANAQAEALEILNQQARVGIMQALTAMATPTVNADGSTAPPPDISALEGKMSLPLMRGAQPPERFTTPDGSGSSTPKLKLPTPGIQTQPIAPAHAAPVGAPGAARGPVQANRNAGNRKEDSHAS